MASCCNGNSSSSGGGGGDSQVAEDENSKRLSVADWKRPAGPINVWRIVDSTKIRGLRFSIQDVPEDRYDETIKHMCDYFVADEATCKALNLKDDRDALEDFRQLWDYLLRKGMSVGVYKLEEGDELGELAGVNILFVVTDEVENTLANITKNFKSPNSRKLFEFMSEVSQKVDILQIYKTDKYLAGLGCSVKPNFRGHQLGVHLLRARDDIGRKYGITVSSTAFTGVASQKQAERAGYQVDFTQEYQQVFNANGEALFPNIDSKCLKIMTKELLR